MTVRTQILGGLGITIASGGIGFVLGMWLAQPVCDGFALIGAAVTALVVVGIVFYIAREMDKRQGRRRR